MRGSWRPNRTAIYWPPLLWPSALCLSRSPGLLNRRSRGPALCWMMAFFTASYHQLVWSANFIGGPKAPTAGCGFPFHILSPTGLIPNSIGGPHQQLLSPSVWLLVLTELYNSSTPTQSPTQSLEWHVWSSSSGNNCHAVHRSLSSSASVYECTMGFFTLVHFVSQARPRYLFRLLAIGMCHFLPAHHFGMSCLAWSKVKIQLWCFAFFCVEHWNDFTD